MNNINCESCGRYICECKDIIAEQEAIERLQEMPVADAVLELWPDPALDSTQIAKLLLIDDRDVLEVVDAV